jgi:uncharacterized membrane protein YhdT
VKKRKDFGQDNVRANLDVRRLILTIVYAIGVGVFGYLIQRVQGQTKRGFTMLFFLICIVLLVRSIKKLLTERLQDAIDEWFENVMRWVFKPAAFLIGKVAKWLGIGRWRGWCEDEKTFLHKERGAGGRRRKRLKNDQKWADQTDNTRRVRYLFVEYMIKRIRGGFLYRRQMTPDEMARELLLEEDEKLLFETYDLARYSQDAEISDEVVKVLSKVTARK